MYFTNRDTAGRRGERPPCASPPASPAPSAPVCPNSKVGARPQRPRNANASLSSDGEHGSHTMHQERQGQHPRGGGLSAGQGVLQQSFSLTAGMRDNNSFPESTWILSTFPYSAYLAQGKTEVPVGCRGSPSHALGLAQRPSSRTPCRQSPQQAPATHRSPCRARRGTLLRSASRRCRCGSSNAPACSAASSPPLADSSRPGAEAAPTRPQ